MQKAIYLLSFFLLNLIGYSQSDLSGIKSRFDQSFFQVQHTNDMNFILPDQNTNDVGFTGSFAIEVFINQTEKKNRLLNFAYRTDLFTERNGERTKENGRIIISEYFTEVSSFDFSISKFFKNQKYAFRFGGGLGLLNKKKPIHGGALWIQGGSDGGGGMHGLLNRISGNSGQKNLSRDKLEPFLFVTPAITKYFYLSNKYQNNPHILLTEIGTNLSTNYDILWLQWNNSGRIHIIQNPSTNKTHFGIDFIGIGNLKLHQDGLHIEARVGVELLWGRFAIGYEVSKQFGDANISFVDFADNDNLYRLFIKLKFPSSKLDLQSN